MTPEALAVLPKSFRLILAAGAPRSGSTAQFNIARMLLEREGASLTAGWIEDIAEPLGTTLLIKVHEWHPKLAKRADVVLTSHRDLREVARSLAAMGWLESGSELFDQIRHFVYLHRKWKLRAAVDSSYETMVKNWRATTAEIAAALFIDASHADFDDVARKVKEMAAPTLLPDGRPHDPVTLMHVKHRQEGRPQPLEIESEIHRRFLSWQTAHGYI